MIGQRVFVEARDAMEKLDLLERIGRVADLDLVDADEARPVARRFVEGLRLCAWMQMSRNSLRLAASPDVYSRL